MMIRLIPLALLVAAPAAAQAPAPLAAPLPVLKPELQLGVRCAALFSILSAEQARGAPGASDWPPLAIRGREFFVRIGAQVMDAAKIDRAGIQALMRREVTALQTAAIAAKDPKAHAAGLKTPCLTMLDATVPLPAQR